jgi:hypothetical protein
MVEVYFYWTTLKVIVWVLRLFKFFVWSVKSNLGMLGIKRPSARGRPCWWTRRLEAYTFLSAPLQPPQIKKIHASSRLSHASLSTVPPVGLPLHRRHARPHHPIAAIACTAGAAYALSPGVAAHRGPHSARCHPSPPRPHSRIPLCCAPPAWLSCFAESACCRRMFWVF